MVRRGLAESRQQAQAAIAAGEVLVAGAPATKPSRLVDPSEPIQLLGPPPRFVSRGGEKLDAALTQFAVPANGRRAVDVGASTGGFTDCLLQRGAAAVTCIDVGHGQLHERLRSDGRVTVVDRTNVRHLRAADVGGPFELVVADLSFISLRTVAPALAGELAAPQGDLVLLVKPQFESGRVEAARGRGVISDPTVWREAVHGVANAMREAGAVMMDAMVSPLLGARGNVEFLLHARVGGVQGPVDLDALVAETADRREHGWPRS